MRRRLLLVSSSRVHGSGYLEHCADAIRDLFSGARRVLFVPWALHDRDGYEQTVRERFAELGLELGSVHRAEDPVRAVNEAEGLFVGGGNTFRLLRCLYESKVVEPIRERVRQGTPYMGSSAGSNVACASIRTTNDMPIVFPPTFEALRLVPFQLNPHFVDADPQSTHMGETRETRLAEYLEENSTPVVGLREGAWLTVDGNSAVVEGRPGGKLFQRGAAPRELPRGTRLDELLADGGGS